MKKFWISTPAIRAETQRACFSRQTSSAGASSIGRREAIATPCQPFCPATRRCGRPISAKASAGNSPFWHLISCRHRTSGACSRTKRAACSARRRTELTFQVQIRRRMDQGLAGRVARSRGPLGGGANKYALK